MYLTEDKIRDFENSLYLSEKSRATVIKYSAALHGLRIYLAGNEISKQRLLEYRDLLLQKRRANTVNGALSAINSYLEFSGLSGCRVKLLKIQRQAFIDERRELSEAEYRRLLSTALKRGKAEVQRSRVHKQNAYEVAGILLGLCLQLLESIYIPSWRARANRYASLFRLGRLRRASVEKGLSNTCRPTSAKASSSPSSCASAWCSGCPSTTWRASTVGSSA